MTVGMMYRNIFIVDEMSMTFPSYIDYWVNILSIQTIQKVVRLSSRSWRFSFATLRPYISASERCPMLPVFFGRLPFPTARAIAALSVSSQFPALYGIHGKSVSRCFMHCRIAWSCHMISLISEIFLSGCMRSECCISISWVAISFHR